MNFGNSTARFIATGFNIGHFPVAPGTLGSVLGLPICFVLSGISIPLALFFTILLILLAIWSAHQTEKILDKKDPGCIVIDEIAGMVVTLIGLPFGLKTAIMGFLIFRLLDIVKPPPIRQIESTFTGGLGVVLDDIVAGIFGNIILRFVFWLTGF
jgi:phosphatidylglycerophosphatase A